MSKPFNQFSKLLLIIPGTLIVLALLCYAPFAQAAKPMDVTLSELIAKPKLYHGKLIQVVGYLHLEFEGNALYLSKEAHEKSHYAKSFWVDLPSEADPTSKAAYLHNDSWVILVGKFDAKHKGHMGLWPGAITQIQQLDSWREK